MDRAFAHEGHCWGMRLPQQGKRRPWSSLSLRLSPKKFQCTSPDQDIESQQAASTVITALTSHTNPSRGASTRRLSPHPPSGHTEPSTKHCRTRHTSERRSRCRLQTTPLALAPTIASCHQAHVPRHWALPPAQSPRILPRKRRIQSPRLAQPPPPKPTPPALPPDLGAPDKASRAAKPPAQIPEQPSFCKIYARSRHSAHSNIYLNL